MRDLFKLFPNLPKQLEEIHNATLRPVEDAGKPQYGNNGYKRKNTQPWNQDVGNNKGVEALKKARKAYGKDGEGVRQYGTLILQLLAKDETNAEELIRRELEEENAKSVKQLLELETALRGG